MIGRYLLEPQGGEGDGTGATATDQGGGKAPDLAKAAEGLVARHGDSTAALLVLLGENHKARDQIRELRAKAPAEGSVVLAGDDAKAWSKYRELGDPSDLRKGLGERDTFKAEAEGFRRAEVVRDVAEVAGKLSATVLRTLVDRDKLDVAVVEEKGRDGKSVRVAVVKGDGDETTPLAEYAEKNWAEFLPALKGVRATPPAGSPPAGPGQPRPPIAPAGVRRSLVK